MMKDDDRARPGQSPHPFSRWLPPSPANPADSMRWVRRITLAMVPVYLVAIMPSLWLSFGGFRWWFLAPAAALLLSALTSGPAIRSAERHGPLSAEEAERALGRVRIAQVVVAIGLPILGAFVGYLLDGLPAALVIGGLMGVGAVLGLVLFRRWPPEGPPR